jgi:hypothetical protein
LQVQAASDYYRGQQQIAVATASGVAKLWDRMGTDFDSSWSDVGPQILNLAQVGRAAAAASSVGYVDSVLSETGQDADPAGVINPARFLESAPDGRDMSTLLEQAPGYAKAAVGRGMDAQSALKSAGSWLTGTLLTVLGDTGRGVVGADIAQRNGLGYTRMLVPPSCSRCAVLAGTWYRWNQGFQRHPRCDCRHIPCTENASGDFTTDPYAYFRSLSPEQQRRVFGQTDARAINDGGDIYRVVNIRQRGLGTSKQAIRFGTPTRMTVDDIYKVAGSRKNAIQLMQREGFILPRGQVVAPIAPGVRTDAQIIAAGRGRGTYRIGDQTVTTARAARYDAAVSGVRDPLNRSTMTAGEKRIFDSFTRAQDSLTGVRARTIGANAADRGVVYDAINPAYADRYQAAFVQKITQVRATGTASERRLADLVWAQYNALI